MSPERVNAIENYRKRYDLIHQVKKNLKLRGFDFHSIEDTFLFTIGYRCADFDLTIKITVQLSYEAELIQSNGNDRRITTRQKVFTNLNQDQLQSWTDQTIGEMIRK